jgi:hypothetical protein
MADPNQTEAFTIPRNLSAASMSAGYAGDRARAKPAGR